MIRIYANYFPASAVHRWPPSRRGEETRSSAASTSRQCPALTLGVTSPGQRLQLGLGFRKDVGLANAKTLSKRSSGSNSHHAEMITLFSTDWMGGGSSQKVFDLDNMKKKCRLRIDFFSVSSGQGPFHLIGSFVSDIDCFF